MIADVLITKVLVQFGLRSWPDSEPYPNR